MIEIIKDGFRRNHLDTLARLHIHSIPKTSFSIIGQQAAALAYAFMAKSDKEVLLAAVNRDTVLGGIVVSFEPSTLTSRLLAKHPFQMCIKAAFPLVKKITRLPEIYKLLNTTEAAYTCSPEIMFLFTDPSQRSKGIGKILVQNALTSLAGRTNTLYVRTLYNEENRALNFYRNNGFKDFQQINYLKKDQIIMAIEI